MSNAQRDIRRKQQGREYATQSGNVRKTCRYLGMRYNPKLWIGSVKKAAYPFA